MKLLLIAFGFLLAVNAFGQRTDMLGTWEIYKIESIQDNSISNERTQFIEFQKKGKFVGGLIEGHVAELQGTWKWNEDGSLTLTQEVTEDSGHSDDGNYKVEALGTSQLKLTSERIVVYIERKK
jgi:hypothetical protein